MLIKQRKGFEPSTFGIPFVKRDSNRGSKNHCDNSRQVLGKIFTSIFNVKVLAIGMYSFVSSSPQLCIQGFN